MIRLSSGVDIATVEINQNVPVQNSADNILERDVVGNKTDTVGGNSIVSLTKQALAAVGTIDTQQDVPAKNGTDNNYARDVIGNKTDDEAGDSLYSKAYIVEKHNHSAAKVYPTLAPAKIINKVNSSAWGLDANTTEVIPVNTIANPFDIHFINIGSLSANDQYELIMYRGGAGAEVEIGRVAFDRSVTVSEGSIPIQTPLVAANTRISCRLSSNDTQARNVSIKLHYHTY